MWDTSKREQWLRVCRWDSRCPRPYCTGRLQPANGTILPPRARCRASSGVRFSPPGSARPGSAPTPAPLSAAEPGRPRQSAAQTPTRSILRSRSGPTRPGSAQHGSARPAGAPGTCGPPPAPPPDPETRHSGSATAAFIRGSSPPTPCGRGAKGEEGGGAKPPGGALGHGRVHAGSRRGSGVGEEVDIVAAVHLRGESCRGCPRSPPLRAGRWGHSRRSGRCGRPPGEPGSPPSAPTFAAPPSTPSPGRGAPAEKQERCCGAPSPGTGLPRRGEGAPA